MRVIKVKNLKDAQEMMRKHKTQKPKKLVVKYYMDGCGACDDFEPKWNNVINKLDIPGSIMIADVEHKAQEHLPIPSKMGFPTLSIMSDKNGTLSEDQEYIGSMREDKLMEILTKVISGQSAGKRKRQRKKTRRWNKKFTRRGYKKTKSKSKSKRNRRR